jgi:hypothetical protein
MGSRWLLVIALGGCTGETGLTTLTPALAVLPEALDFGEVVAGEATAEQQVFVDNGGRATLEGTVYVDGTDAGLFSLGLDVAELSLPADEGLDFRVTFAPTEVAPAEAALVFETNDPDSPTLVVPLVGVGRVPYAPDIEVTPTRLDFGDVDPGDDATLAFALTNTGDADLTLGTLSQTGAGAFLLRNDYSGQRVPPGQTQNILITYTANVLGTGDSGVLRIPSDDADEAVVEVQLEANGGGEASYPEAVVDCPGTVDLTGPVDVVLDGSASSDPSGLDPLTYAWTLIRRPTAADESIAPTPADAASTTVRIDTAGTWEVQLQVTNTLGVPSAPTKCVIEAVPVDQLHVELSWAGPTSDLDLHLADGDAAFYSVPGDVSWCNRSPDWGRQGATDDPSLDVDDDDGFGPEVINVASPADGAYPVRVHLFDDADDGDVTARVTVFAMGREVFSGSRVLRRNQVWDVGEVNWPQGTFAVSSTRPWDAEGTRGCE